MPKLIILGSSNAVPSANHDNTHMVLVGRERSVLIDCSSSPFRRLMQAGVDPLHVTDVVITHFHPDHVSGLPLFLMNLWLAGRRKRVAVRGCSHSMERAQSILEIYGWRDWPNMFEIDFVTIPEREMANVLACDEFTVYASPVHHLIPTLGLRVEFPGEASSFAYSADTEPCDEVARLAAGCDILLHEAAGAGRGHSSARQAGEIASRAEVHSLFLIHYPTGEYSGSDLLTEARNTYQGRIDLATHFMTFNFGASAQLTGSSGS
jgi:ribonuclease Z